MEHVPVLLEPTVDALLIAEKPQGVFLDCTFGRGGHASLVLKRLGVNGRLYALDRDPQAVAQMQAIEDARFLGKRCAFAD